jgi:hypothetical protein
VASLDEHIESRERLLESLYNLARNVVKFGLVPFEDRRDLNLNLLLRAVNPSVAPIALVVVFVGDNFSASVALSTAAEEAIVVRLKAFKEEESVITDVNPAIFLFRFFIQNGRDGSWVYREKTRRSRN